MMWTRILREVTKKIQENKVDTAAADNDDDDYLYALVQNYAQN